MTRAPVEIRIGQGAGEPWLFVSGREVTVAPGADPIATGFGVVAASAKRQGGPVPAVLIDEREAMQWRVLVHADGTVTDDPGGMATVPVERHSARRGALVALSAVVLLGGLAYGIAAQPLGKPTGTDALPTGLPASAPPTTVPAEAFAPPSASATPTVPPSPEPAPAGAAPPASPDPGPVGAYPPVTAGPRPGAAQPVARPVTSAPARPVATARPASPAPARPASPAPVRTVAPAAPVTALVAAPGRCLTGSLTVAACDRSAAQAWTMSGGQLRHGGQCLSYGNGLALVACGAVRTGGWAAGGVTTNGDLCLEALGARAALTQCGTGAALVLRTV